MMKMLLQVERHFLLLLPMLFALNQPMALFPILDIAPVSCGVFGKTSSLILNARPPSFLASLKRAKRNMETTNW